MDTGRNNSARGGRGSSRGQGGDGRGSYQTQGGRGGGNNRSNPNQGGGRGSDAPPHRGPQHQAPPQQAWGNRPPFQPNQPPPQQAWGNRPPVQGNQPPPQQAGVNRPPVQANQPPPQQAWINRPPVQANQPPPQQAWGNRPPVQVNQPPRPQQAWVNRPPVQVNQPPRPQQAWGNRPPAPQQLAPSPVGPSTAPPTPVHPGPSLQAPHQPSADQIDLQSLKISEEKTAEKEIQVIKRPDNGGIIATKKIRLLVNHFPVKFNPNSTILHYDVTVKPTNDNEPVKKKLRKFEMALIRDKLFSENDRMNSNALLKKCVYDSEKNIFSAVTLPTGVFTVDIGEGEDVKRGSYTFTIKFVNELKLSKLKDYIAGNQSYIPRDILQGMDLVMKDNPSRSRINVGRSYYANEYQRNHDLGGGVAAHRGFHQSLKPTSRGLSLCLDYSVISFRKPWPVIEFLKENVKGFRGVDDVNRLRREVNGSLKGLKVRVTHRRTKQKYTVVGLSNEDARDCFFELVDQEGINPPRRTSLVDYFREKWGKEIMYPNVPCLELGRSANKSNKVPMEFCELVEGQRFPKENLERQAGVFLKDLSLARPRDRMMAINEMVRANDGPSGDVTRNFGIEVDMNMTKVTGRVIGPPVLRLGNSASVNVDAEKRQWNLLGKTLVDGRSIDRWALIDFTEGDRFNKLVEGAFINNLRGRCRNLRINMAEPLVYRRTRMQELSSVNRLENLLKSVVDESGRASNGNGKLQLIVCVMTRRDPGYRYLKWVSETKIGVITQCCLSQNANKGQDQYLANLCLKINAKLGGSNFELHGKLPHFGNGEHVMFIGADVNHPSARNTECPSIAAVVGTINWPAANRYAARVSPQARRCETIMNFGTICLDLVNTYAKLNGVRPTRLVLFRDGVSDGQFEMVLGQELYDLKKAFGETYQPSITVIVAQKRHLTRLFLENERDGGRTGNVPPGTVVDTEIVHPHNFDFFLCSHYGGLGMSKPTHYYVLWDENFFTSDELQKLIYDMCFTYARCTKPVSLVPPVYYADLVAYRGRMFQEVLLESASSSAHRASPSGNVSFDQSFYNLHSNLKDIMFFV